MIRQKRKILAFILLIFFTAYCSIVFFGPRMIIQVHGGLYSILRPIKNNSKLTPIDYQLNAEHLHIRTIDGLSLSAYIIKSNTDTQNGTIILLHGIRANKEHFLPLAKQLADSSYNSVIIDLRAHGESEGKYCTFGFLEKYDISILVDSLYNRSDLNKNIGIWGQSLGGSIAMQSMATTPKIKYGIIESTFSDFDIIVHDYMQNYLGFDIPFLTNYLISRASKITYFEPSDVKPYLYARKIVQPIIISHGSLDDRITIDNGLKNFNNVSSSEKEFIEIVGANHLNLWEVGGQDYFNKIFKFLNDRQIENK